MKQIKDPIYGYINIENDYTNIIDTPEYQRLRNIIQTSYQALYPSALHNRFTHSIGVFHLGKKAFTSFRRNVESDFPNFFCGDWDKLQDTFLMACLLHDVGHSPFSHTGEGFYKDNFREEIHKILPLNIELYQDMEHGTGKPHEAMSAIVGIRLIRRLDLPKIDEDLFIRAIIGVRYEEKDTSNERLIRNIVIGMLNGSLIDVDKLDYLIRDGYVTGFNTMSLDVERLFAGYTIADYVDPSASMHRVPAYKRGALSVIENVTFANDLERHWIQNHPSILYDAKLVDLAIVSYDSFMKKKYKEVLTEKTVFTQKALSLDGYIDQGVPLSLLSDEDIITYLKNGEDQSEGAVLLRKQYFGRSERLKPLWKSESEFSHLEHEIMGSAVRRSFKAALKAISGHAFFINEVEKNKAFEQKILMEKAVESEDPNLKSAAKTSLSAQEDVIRIFQIFNQFCLDKGLDFNFAFLFVEHHYESNYSKLQNSDIYIEFSGKRVIPFRDALSVAAVQPNEDEKNGYYYIYSAKKNIKQLQERNIDFGREILTYISQNWMG